jgi:predicted O-methyltransferase YrrM
MEAYTNFIKEIQKLPIRVGSITPPQQDFILKFLAGHPEIKEVLETGFHIGLSAATMLEARPDIYVTSFDIFWFDYTRRAKLLLDIYYPTRNILIAGNSVCSLQTFFARFPTYKPDFVFIDGGHERPIPFLDLYFIMKNIPVGTWIMIDDYCEEHGSNGVIEAVDEIINEGYIENIKAYKAHDRGWILAQRSDKEVKYSEKTSEAELNKVYKDIESQYPS